jgi:hypothetical protein
MRSLIFPFPKKKQISFRLGSRVKVKKLQEEEILTIYVRTVPFVYMARDGVMIFMRENTFRGPLEGVDPENRAFLGPEMATSEASAIWTQKKSKFSGPTPFNGPSNRLSRIKIIIQAPYKKTGTIPTLVILCTSYKGFCILYSVLYVVN